MLSRSIHRLREHPLLVLPLLWIAYWITPWASWLDSFPWIRVGVCILFFTVPGMAISLLLLGQQLSIYAHFTSGLAISVLLVGSLGLFGRIVHLPFGFIRPVFALIGLLTLLALVLYPRFGWPFYKPNRFSLSILVLLLGMFVVGVVTSLQNKFGGDDFSYLAYLTNWQHAQPLSFQSVIFESGDVDVTRFWLSMLPMNLAFLAEISHLHGLLLLGIYLEPFLVIIAILACYNLYEDFLQNEHLAVAATLLHFTFFVLLQGRRQPGVTLFFRMSEDKAFAALILAPVFFLAMRHFLSSSTFRSGAFAFLSGLALTLTHPVILAYSLFIAGLYTSILCIVERNYKKFGVSIALLVIMVLPAVILRFIDGPTRYAINLQLAIDAYSEDSGGRFSYIEGTPFYGFDITRIKIRIPETDQESLLQAFFSWSYLWLLVIGFVWSIFNLKKKATAPFVFATSVLVLLCGIPYTGWLMGYFVSAGMLWRSPWLFPIGLIGIVLAADAVKFVSHKVSPATQPNPRSDRVILWPISVICIVLIVYFSIPKYEALKRAMFNRTAYETSLEHFSVLGNYLENHIERSSIFLAPRDMMNLLPGLTSKAEVVFFRSWRLTPHRVDLSKIERIFSPDASIPIKQRMNILRRYRVQYVLINDRSLMDYYAGYPNFFNIQEAHGFWILELRAPSSSLREKKLVWMKYYQKD